MWRTMHQCCCASAEATTFGEAIGTGRLHGEPLRAAATTRAWQRKLDRGGQRHRALAADMNPF